MNGTHDPKGQHT